jgi:hypothetical protein
MNAFLPAEAAASRSNQNATRKYEQTPTPSHPTNVSNRLFASTNSTMEKTNRFR